MNRNRLPATLGPFQSQFFTVLRRCSRGTSLVLDTFGESFVRADKCGHLFAFDPSNNESWRAAFSAATSSRDHEMSDTIPLVIGHGRIFVYGRSFDLPLREMSQDYHSYTSSEEYQKVIEAARQYGLGIQTAMAEQLGRPLNRREIESGQLPSLPPKPVTTSQPVPVDKSLRNFAQEYLDSEAEAGRPLRGERLRDYERQARERAIEIEVNNRRAERDANESIVLARDNARSLAEMVRLDRKATPDEVREAEQLRDAMLGDEFAATSYWEQREAVMGKYFARIDQREKTNEPAA